MFILITAAVSLYAGDKAVLALFRFDAPTNMKNTAVILGDFINIYLFRGDKFQLISPDSARERLAEMNLQDSGCTSEQCWMEKGRGLKADYIVTGSLSDTVGKISLTWRIFSIRDESAAYATSTEISVGTLEEDSKRVAMEILTRFAEQFLALPDLMEDEKYSRLNTSTQRGKVIGRNGSYYTLNAGSANLLKDGSIVYIMNGEDVGATLKLIQVDVDSSKAIRLRKYIKGTEIKPGDVFYIPKRVKFHEHMFSNRFTLGAINTYPSLKYERRFIIPGLNRFSASALIGTQFESHNEQRIILSGYFYITSYVSAVGGYSFALDSDDHEDIGWCYGVEFTILPFNWINFSFGGYMMGSEPSFGIFMNFHR